MRSEQGSKLEQILNDVDGVINRLKTQSEEIPEEPAYVLAKVALMGAKQELEKVAGRKLKQPVIVLELEEDPCAACIVVSQMHEKGLVEDCHGCSMEAQREAFIASRTDGSGD